MEREEEALPPPKRPCHNGKKFDPCSSIKTLEPDAILGGHERWVIARVPTKTSKLPSQELSALSERIHGFHTHAFAFKAAEAWIEQDVKIFGPGFLLNFQYHVFIQGRI